MIHIVIVPNTIIFQHLLKQTGAKKVPLVNISYEVYSYGSIRIIGKCKDPVTETLVSFTEEFNPDTVFFLSESYPVSNEKLSGDIILPNVFFPFNTGIETMEMTKEAANSFLSVPIFLEHYPLQGDYNFESFGLSVGGIHVSGAWNADIEDFRIRLRVVYENDTFDSELYRFIEAAKTRGTQEKMYPVAYITTNDTAVDSSNLWNIIQFIIGSIDLDLMSEEDDEIEVSEEEDESWIDGSEEEK